MEVDRSNFADVLPTILKRIAESEFIAFDLEFTGIPPQRQRELAGKATLQERYEETKLAAETYHVHQFGITCAEKLHRYNDPTQYSLRAFNFNISPLIDDKLGVDRKFTYSSSAVQFLMGYGHSMEAPFTHGIPYLSREEEKAVGEHARRKLDRFTIPDIQLREDDKSARNLVQTLKRDLQAWTEEKKSGSSFLVGGINSSSPSLCRPLNRFEKRLVHQTVRAYFPDYKTYSREEYIKVQFKDYQEDAHERNELHARIMGDVSRQTGFRWVAEALCGGDMDRLWECVSRNMPRIQEEVKHPAKSGYHWRILELQKACQARPKILVGHNCFMDLIFLFKIFYGNLPERVEDFQALIHETFPLIVDTKYLSTCGKDSRFRGARLAQLDSALSDQAEPLIEQSSPWHTHYDATNPVTYHEAGFDSLVTARTFLRLASRLTSASGADDLGKLKKENQQPRSEAEGPPVSHKPLKAEASIELVGTEKVEEFEERKPVSDTEDRQGEVKETDENIPSNTFKSKMKTKGATKPAKSSHATYNPFSLLDGIPPDENSTLHSEAPTLLPQKSSSIAEAAASSGQATTAPPVHSTAPPDTQNDYEPRNPPFPPFPAFVDTDGDEDAKESAIAFWTRYGNKLRVYGTVEELCDLTQVKGEGEKRVQDGKANLEATSTGREAHWLWKWLWSWVPGWGRWR